MATLIFEPSVTGHHLEYLHHYYEGALDTPNETFIFLVTKNFKAVQDKYSWTESNNVSFIYLDDKCEDLYKTKNPYLLGWKLSRLLSKYVRDLKPDSVILTMLMQFVPFICFLLPKSVRVRGIMYRIYLYEENRMSRVRLTAERFRFWIASRSQIIERIFVLNDEESANQFNKIYKTKKFRFLPDPVPEIDISKCKDIRSDLGIQKGKKIFLHFGGLAKRKGTIDILRSLEKISDTELSNLSFIFAGKQSADLKEEFYPLYDVLKKRVQILVFDEFCSYEFLYNLCYSSDVILLPYHDTNLSSGIIGYAALFKKPVIGPACGLIGRLIQKYQMGITLDKVDAPSVAESLQQQITCNSYAYVLNNSKIAFINAIYR